MAKEKFLLVSLSENKAKELAQAVANETCRKILDYLADNDATESELAEKLSVPISTVHYNLQQLQKGGLVIVEEYHYSKKGKEINHYKLANKYIIIAPKSTYGIKEKLKGVLPVILITAAGAAIIQFFSKAFRYGKVSEMTTITKSFEAVPAARDAAVESAKAVMAEEVVEGTSASAGAMAEVSDVAVEKTLEEAPAAAQKLVENVTTATQTTITEPSIFANVALWFLIGAIVSIMVYLVVDWVRNRK